MEHLTLFRITPEAYTDVLWDFNGTLLDDLFAAVEANNRLLARRGLPTFDNIDDYRTLSACSITEFYRRMGFDLDRESFEDIAAEWAEEYIDASREARLSDAALPCIARFHEMGLRQSVLSAAESNMLRKQLETLGLANAFCDLIGLKDFHTVDKTDAARHWANAHPGARALLIGDTEHDAAVAREIGADCILCEGGHRSRECLLACGFPVITSLSELL